MNASCCEHKAYEARDDGAVDEGGVLEPEDRDIEKDITQCAAANGRDHGNNHHAEKIQFRLAVSGREHA